MNEQVKERWGCLQWGLLVFCLFLLVQVVLPSLTRVSPRGDRMIGASCCKQIILSLRQYSYVHEDEYPDGQKREFHSANEVFRELFKDGIVTDESIFGCPTSRFCPDNELGSPPDFAKCLQPGECHWMVLKHRSLATHPRAPVLIENSLTASWPPKWSLETNAIRGRSWPGQRIIIGRNDGTVSLERLNEDGTIDWHSESNLGPDGKSWIDSLSPEQISKLSYWDIEEK